MPILLVLLGLGVVLYLWWARRGATLTRDCRWRLDRAAGPGHFRCAACGAVTSTAGGTPRGCQTAMPPAQADGAGPAPGWDTGPCTRGFRG
jgi:hypothetical protein